MDWGSAAAGGLPVCAYNWPDNGYSERMRAHDGFDERVLAARLQRSGDTVVQRGIATNRCLVLSVALNHLRRWYGDRDSHPPAACGIESPARTEAFIPVDRVEPGFCRRPGVERKIRSAQDKGRSTHGYVCFAARGFTIHG